MSVLEEEIVHSLLECQESVSKGILHYDSRFQASVPMAQIAVCLGKMMTKEIIVQDFDICRHTKTHTPWIISGTLHLHHIKESL